jgi:hypothetical protein
MGQNDPTAPTSETMWMDGALMNFTFSSFG